MIDSFEPLTPQDPQQPLDQLRQQQAAGTAPALLPFWGHSARGPHIGPWVLSQWWPAPFDVDMVSYPHAEAYMMAAKARLFDDQDALDRILTSTTPKQAKALGRTVRNFDSDVWEDNAYRVVVEANQAKFAQHPALASFLAATAPAVLVEASPFDHVWGIGMGKDHPDARDAWKWRGRNLLGFALTEVRERLTS